MLTERSLSLILRDHPFAKDLGADHVASLAGCAKDCVIAAGDYVWRQGEQADVFYLIYSGTVALEISVPQQGPLQIETIKQGEILGWSWLVPPYRWHFDARAITEVCALRLEGRCLRQKCEHDQLLGYQVVKRLAAVIAERLEATRLRLLDLYGPRRP